MGESENSIAKPSPLVRYLALSMFGLTFMWSPMYGTSEASVFPRLVDFPGEIFVAHMLCLAAFAISCVTFAVIKRSGKPLAVTPRKMIGASAVYLVGFLLSILYGVGTLGFPAMAVGAILRGASSLPILVGWLNMFVRQESGGAATPIIGVLLSIALYALAGIAVVAAGGLSVMLASMLLCLCPIASCLGYLALDARTGERGARHDETTLFQKRTERLLYAANFLYGTIYGALLGCFTMMTTVHSMFVFLTAAAVMALIVYVQRKTVNLSTIFRGFALFTAAAGIVAALLVCFLPDVGFLISSGALAIIIFFTCAIFIDAEMNSSEGNWGIVSICLLCSSCGIIIVETFIYIACVENLPGNSTLLMALAGICFIAVTFMPNTHTSVSAWGFSNMLPPESPEAKRMRSCGRIAADYDLTARELEVLQLLSGGNGKEEIAEALVISPNTAKTHIHNVYAKLGIHGGKQLEALIEENR